MSLGVVRLWRWRKKLNAERKGSAAYRLRYKGVVAPWPRLQSTGLFISPWNTLKIRYKQTKQWTTVILTPIERETLQVYYNNFKLLNVSIFGNTADVCATVHLVPHASHHITVDHTCYYCLLVANQARWTARGAAASTAYCPLHGRYVGILTYRKRL
jgi:hypothetical protein